MIDLLKLPGPACPVCGARHKTLFVCPSCWWKIPANDRRQLGTMHRNKQDTTSKVASVVRALKEKA